MSDYVKKAIRTESIVGADVRVANVFSNLSMLNEELFSTVEIMADGLKKYIYYGKKSPHINIEETALDGIPKHTVTEQQLRLLHAGLGLLTEAQEFLAPVIYSISHGGKLDLVNLKEELGDMMWYEAIACDTLGTTFEEEQDRNIAKLTKRYPEKFTEELAINRDVAAEREVLEGNK